ncbi:TlpA disulfide reductase family protein [Parabacteroides sp. PF5-9]|uniref:TlpA disulfide reductase family protein n=1 Tax=Parabacteroides sp. PF5-9 TaxID=1742404 RepID=UPI00247C8943|nr:peroxiredoxin [Parabacteroides sp. PF5-9]
MKHTTSQLFFVFCIFLLHLTGCRNASEFMVEGTVSGADGQLIYLENVGISSITTLDSLRLSSSGKFKFKEQRPDYPDFYRLRLNNQLINFAIDSTETVSFVADAGTFATSYSVEGSENSKAIKSITLAQLDANQAVKKLRKEHENDQIADSTYSREINGVVDAYKAVARQYIYAAPMSTAAYFALFQQIDGLLFFDLYDKEDSKAYGAVATSFDFRYPDSPRSKHLHNLALQSLRVTRAQRERQLEIEANEISFLEIDLPNIRGEQVKLSSVAKNRPVIVNFTAFQSEWSSALNLELGELYTKYQNKGLTIYQVSLDSDLHLWQNRASNLPWTCVRDPESVYSQIAALYNVKQLPTIFILDRKGNLIEKIEDIRLLESAVKKVL